MRKTSIKTVLFCALCLAAGSTLAQSTYGGSGTMTDSDRNQIRSSDYSTGNETSSRAGESTKFFKSKDLIGADIKDSQGNKIGDISELVVNHMTGETLATVSVSGGRYAVIPVQAFQVSRPAGMIRNAVVTLNTTKQELQTGPTIAKDEWSRLDDQAFVQSIYSRFHMQQPSAMGGSESSTLGGTTSGSELKHEKQQDSTDNQAK